MESVSSSRNHLSRNEVDYRKGGICCLKLPLREFYFFYSLAVFTLFDLFVH